MKTLQIDTRYALQSDHFKDGIPLGTYIDKTVCGCGLTTVALESKKRTLILVPTVALVKNKFAQYPNERFPHYILPLHYENEEFIEQVLESENVEPVYSDEYGLLKLLSLEKYVRSVPHAKVVGTYESISLLLGLGKAYKDASDDGDEKKSLSYDTLKLFDEIIIDESNKLISTSHLKATGRKSIYDESATDLILQHLEPMKHKISFVSATPIPLRYLPNWVQELEQVKYEWKYSNVVTSIKLIRSSPEAALVREVLIPLKRNGVVTVQPYGKPITKVIVYMNSIAAINRVYKDAKLRKKDAAIICGLSSAEKASMDPLKDYANLPLVTFVTSAGFEGIDLYDKEAANIVVAKASTRSSLMIDMDTDFIQIISRQRDSDNPHYKKAIFIFNEDISAASVEEVDKIMTDAHEHATSAVKAVNHINKDSTDDTDRLIEEWSAKSPATVFIKPESHGNKTVILNSTLFAAASYQFKKLMDVMRDGFVIASSNLEKTDEPAEIYAYDLSDFSWQNLVALFRAGFFKDVIDSFEALKHYNKVFPDDDRFKQYELLKRYFETGLELSTTDFNNAHMKINGENHASDDTNSYRAEAAPQIQYFLASGVWPKDCTLKGQMKSKIAAGVIPAWFKTWQKTHGEAK